MLLSGESLYLGRLVSRLLAAALILGCSAAQASKLSDISAALAPGQWATLNTSTDGSGFNAALLCAELKAGESRCGDNILNYAGEGSWNRTTREVHFIGSGHLRETKHISYTEATNTWKLETNPSWNCIGLAGCAQYASIGHNFDAVTMNPATGALFVRLPGYAGSALYRRDPATKAWTALPAAPPSAYTMALEYFPEMQGLVLMGGGYVYLLRDGASTWERLASGLTMGSYGSVASYNPTHHVIMFGGGDNDQGVGNRSLYRLDASGTVTPAPSPPENFGVQLSQFVLDPASSRHLLFTKSGGFHEYDVAENRWRTLKTTLPTVSTRPVQWTAVVPIDTYGVVLLLAQHDFNDFRVHVYRHAASRKAPAQTASP